jgi:DeoR family transcriptional regulator of aga operon
MSSDNLPPLVRRRRMLEFVRAREHARVTELSEAFGVSEVTVRTDLDQLEERGLLRRVHGAAVARAPVGHERPFEQEEEASAAEKRRIGAAAANLVSSGDTVILDVGTTTTAVARALVGREELEGIVVFTNALTIALELEAVAPRVSVVLTGGTLRPLQHSLVDPLAGLILERIHANIAFLGCNGVDPKGGVTNVNLPETEVKQRILRAARRRVVVADGSKVGEVEVARLCDVEDVDLLITDATADAEVLDELRERGLDVLVAG